MTDTLMCTASPEDLEREVAAWVEGLLERPEPTWYLWGGDKSPETGLDCSGLVCWACRQISTPLPLGRPNTDVLWRQLLPGKGGPGQLALYGHGDVDPADPACHVMIGLSDGRVAGMSGGGRANQSIAYSRVHGARLLARKDHLYRADFAGWRRLPFHLVTKGASA